MKQVLICQVCGVEFTPRKTNTNRDRPCCTRKCGYKYRSIRRKEKASQRHIGDRFWPQVAVGASHECWEWQFHRDKANYGRFKIGQRSERAHRVAYQLAKGEIPTGLVVRHTCDNPPCCNPNHLLIGTVQDNNQDCVERGRFRLTPMYGSEHPRAIITEEQVLKVRALRDSGVRAKEIAAMFNISISSVYAIGTGRSWKWL